MRDWGKTGALWVAITVMLTTMCIFITDADAASNKLLFSAQFGWEVDATTNGNICTVESHDTCQPGVISESAGGFHFAGGVAVNWTTSQVYVADNDSNRVQVFDASGQFLRMFGWNVNKTKLKEGAPQAERNICTETVKGECQSGVGGGLAGQMFFPQSISIDQVTGDVFVQTEDGRVDKYTAAGEFIWAIGGMVNKTAGEKNGATEVEENICTAISGDTCQQATRSPIGSTLSGVFNPTQHASILAVGGPSDLLYVGDQGRVQRFNTTTGSAVPEISLHSLSPTGFVKAIDVDSSGNVYLVYSTNSAVIRKYNEAGVEQENFEISHGNISGLALDGLGRVAITEPGVNHGTLYSLAGEELGVFAPPEGINSSEGLAFDGSGEHLYVADIGNQDIEIYGLAPVAKALTGFAKCVQGPDSNTLATFGCELSGEVNPEGVPGTAAWFQYGPSTLGLNTPKQPIVTGNSFVSLAATVSALRPNEIYYYRAVAEDQNTGGEPVTGLTLQVRTGIVPPRITCGEPEAFDVTRSSVVLSCDMNPENTSTVYEFQYGACPALETKVARETKLANEEEEECPGELETPSNESSVYSELGVVRTATGLQPSKNYHFRLVAANDHNEEALGEEGTFTTPAAPKQSASTGVPVGVGTTSTTLTGIVNPDGAEATYTFQVGIYKGDETVFGSVGSGSTGPATGPEAESFTLMGLQPGVKYAYRLLISSAYGTAAGATVEFTTMGLSDVVKEPDVVNMFAVPKIMFPKQVKSLTAAQQLAKALKSCRATKSKRKRARVTCETRARKRYGPASKTQKKKA